MSFLLLYAAYVFGVYAFFVWAVPLLFICARFLGICAWETAKLLLQAVWWVLCTGLPLAWAAGRNAVLFVMIFRDEWRHAGERDHEHDHHDAGAHHDAEDRQHGHLLADALLLLGLTPGFKQEDLERAYKRAIRAAHPDAGGSAAQAAAVNVARDLIIQEMGWSRS